MAITFMEKEISLSNARAEASDTHYTILKWELSDIKADLLGKKKSQGHHAVKMSARYVAHEMMKELHASQAQEKALHAREVTEKKAQKAEEEAAHEVQIQEETETKVFTGAPSLDSHFLFLTHPFPPYRPSVIVQAQGQPGCSCWCTWSQDSRHGQ